MARRKKIGLLFSYDENWIGGSYYLINIVHALNSLPNERKPLVIILSIKYEDFELIKEETSYPFLKYQKFPRDFTIIERIINKISRVVIKRGVIHNFSKLRGVDFVYPNPSSLIKNNLIKKVYWIPDFQEEFLPHFFSQKELEIRKNNQKKIVDNADIIVFSSKDAQSHFQNLYPNSQPLQFILPFAVTHPNLGGISVKKIQNKYKLPIRYFFAPNQFWIHKNQILILKAVKLLKKRGIEVFVAFSGKEEDYRNKGYVDMLKEFIDDNDINDNICFLGFLDRKEQLLLMKASIAIIQPSLFEGWSTVVEDAKSLGKHILASDLDVHKEQLNVNCDFFIRDSEIELAELLCKYVTELEMCEVSVDYSINISKFGADFVKLIEL